MVHKDWDMFENEFSDYKIPITDITDAIYWVVLNFSHPCRLWIITGGRCSHNNLKNEFSDFENSICDILDNIICNI